MLQTAATSEGLLVGLILIIAILIAIICFMFPTFKTGKAFEANW